VVGWQGASEAAVVNALQPERCDTAKRSYAAATKPVGTGAEDNGAVVARQALAPVSISAFSPAPSYPVPKSDPVVSYAS